MERAPIRLHTRGQNIKNRHITPHHMQPTKVYYSIAEVRQLTELPVATLRYWEQQFAQLSPYKDEHGNRYYTEKDIALIKQIKYIRDELHITRIEAIRNELKSGNRKTDVRQQASEILLRVREELAEIRANIYTTHATHLPHSTSTHDAAHQPLFCCVSTDTATSHTSPPRTTRGLCPTRTNAIQHTHGHRGRQGVLSHRRG